MPLRIPVCEHCIEDQRRYNWLTPAYSMYIYSLQNSLCVGRSSRVLREVELNIIRHEKCNQILKDIMGRIFTLVQEGGVCGYNMRGGDACQVSSWVPCHSAPLVLPSDVPKSQTLGPGLCPRSPIHCYSS